MSLLPGSWPVGSDGQLVENHVIPGPSPRRSYPSRLFRNFLDVFRRNNQSNDASDDGGPETSKRLRTDPQPQQSGPSAQNGSSTQASPTAQSGPSTQTAHEDPHTLDYWRNLNDGGPRPYRRTPLPGREPGAVTSRPVPPGRFCTDRRDRIEQQLRNFPSPSPSDQSPPRPDEPYYQSAGELFNREEEISLPGLPAESLSPNFKKFVQLEAEKEHRRVLEQNEREQRRVEEQKERERRRQAEQNKLAREKELREAIARYEKTKAETEYLKVEIREATERIRAAKKRETDREAAEQLQLRRPNRPLITPLSDEWNTRVGATIRNDEVVVVQNPEGTQITKHDFAKLIPNGAWLNDNIIQGVLVSLAHEINDSAGVVFKKDAPKCVAVSPLFYEHISKNGGKNTERRLSRTWGVTPDNFLEIDTFLLPINHGNHWTVIVVRPSIRTIAFVDSFHGNGRRHLETALTFIQAFLGPRFVEEEWQAVTYDVPRQTNGYDCGVFVITNSIHLALGLDPSTYSQDQMPLMRRRMAAMLLNGGFRGAFGLAGL